MADPEQIYQEVLQEEQSKGVSGPVAEGRAKAARARAEEGSPHPKEAKWWPGAQPHLEGGDAEPAEAEAEEAAPETEEAAPEAEQPAAEATADVQAPEEEQEQTPAPPEPSAAPPVAPAETGAAAAASAEPAPAAAAPAPAAAAAAPAPRPSGVTHGTTTGTRLRPEDEVTTEAQFAGQQAMYERRKLIDELVATGVPQVTAADTGRARSPWLAVLYLIIPLLVVAYLAGQESGEGEAAATETEATEEAPADGGGGGAPTLVASQISWDTDTLELSADEPTEVTIDNQDTALHNMSIYPDEAAAESQSDALFTGEDVEAGATATYKVDPLKPGTYTFICDYHLNMKGEVNVQ